MKKLAEYGVDGLDVYVELTPYVEEIASSKSVTAVLDSIRSKPAEERGTTRAGRDFIKGLIPIVIKEQRDATLHIIAILSGSTVEEVSGWTAPQIMRTVGELANDPDLMRFFTSFVDIKGAE